MCYVCRVEDKMRIFLLFISNQKIYHPLNVTAGVIVEIHINIIKEVSQYSFGILSTFYVDIMNADKNSLS